MLRLNVYQLVKRLFRTTPSRNQRRAARFRPALERLETRLTPSTVNWIGGSGNWSDANNWRDASTGMNHVPGSSDDAVINTSGINVTLSSVSETLHSLTSKANLLLNGATHLGIDGGNLNFLTGPTISNDGGGASISLNHGSDISGDFTVTGPGNTFTMGGFAGDTHNISSNVTITPGSFFTFAADGFIGGSYTLGANAGVEFLGDHSFGGACTLGANAEALFQGNDTIGGNFTIGGGAVVNTGFGSFNDTISGKFSINAGGGAHVQFSWIHFYG